MEDKYKWEIIENGNTDVIYVDRNTLIDFELINKLFEEIKETLKYNHNKNTGVMNSYLAGYVAQKTAEIFDIINTNGRIKYAVSKLELKKNND